MLYELFGILDKAFCLYQEAAHQGLADAQNNLGMMYEFGDGVTKNFDQAIYWYQEAANQEFGEAQYNLGTFYYYGDLGLVQDHDEAIKLLTLAANQEVVEAYKLLGLMYKERKDYKEAAHWFKKGADLGFVDEQYHFGMLYKEGLGVNQNNKKAAQWFKKAAEQGHKDAEHEYDEIIGTIGMIDWFKLKLNID